MDSIGSDPIADSTENAEPVLRAVDMDVRMEDDSVPEESDITYHQEVMTGYENKPIVPTYDWADPLPSRCAHGAETNETISFVPKQIASANAKDRSAIIHKSPPVNNYKVASAKMLSIPTSSIPERVVYKPTSICNSSPHIAKDPKAFAKTNLACSTLCNKLVTFHESNKNPDPGLVNNIKSFAVYVDDESLPWLMHDTTSDYMGFNYLAHIKGEKVVGGMVSPAMPSTNFSVAWPIVRL